MLLLFGAFELATPSATSVRRRCGLVGRRIGVVGRAGPRPPGCFLGNSRRSVSGEELSTGRDYRFGPLMHGLDDLGVVDPAQVSRGDRKIRVPELALDHD